MKVFFQTVANSNYHWDFDEIIVELSKIIDIKNDIIVTNIENDYVIVKIDNDIFKITETDIERL